MPKARSYLLVEEKLVVDVLGRRLPTRVLFADGGHEGGMLGLNVLDSFLEYREHLYHVDGMA